MLACVGGLNFSANDAKNNGPEIDFQISEFRFHLLTFV